MYFKLLTRIAMVVFAMAFSILSAPDFFKANVCTHIAYSQDYTLISEAELHKKVIASVQKAYQDDSDNIAEIIPPRLSPIRVAKSAKINLQVVGDIRNGRLPIELTLVEDKRVIRKQRLFVKIDFFTKVWALNKDLDAGHTLAREDIHEIKVASRKVARGQITDPDMVVGALLRRASKAETALNKSLLQIPKLIKRGSLVELIFKKGGIFLIAEGEALGDGQRGDMIKVKNLKSKKIVTGRVIGVNKVDVGR
jgi:flagella basal body P-ring formation protein FlgA